MSNCTAGLQSDWFNYNSFTTNKQIVTYFLYFFKKMGQPWPLFRLFFIFSNKQYNFYNKSIWKMSIQYTAQGFEPTTFRHELSPITTRTGLPSSNIFSCLEESLLGFWADQPYFDTFPYDKCSLSKSIWSVRRQSLHLNNAQKCPPKMTILCTNLVLAAIRAVVVAQLVQRLLWTPEVCHTNPVIGKLLYRTFICLLSTVLKRRK